MTNQELITALRRSMAETGSLVCLGCGHEHSCSAHGCSIMREAADALERLGSQAGVVRCGDCYYFEGEICCCADSIWCADFTPEDCSCKFGKIREDRP